MSYTNNKIFFILLILVLCFSMLLTGCEGDSSHAGENESQEQEEQKAQEQNKIYSKFTITTANEVYRDFTTREEIDEKLKSLLETGIGECVITLRYTYKFDPTALEENGYEVEYPKYEKGYYEATLVDDIDKIDYERLYGWASDDNLLTVNIHHWENGVNAIPHTDS